ncbi:MAG: hypothetical protein CVU84_05765 [Firmicutes bacterium HGW-Firmicutes-1]|jgi:RNA polymerase sigma factor|nr:MAG: hypothetical protein CVU84_05765 [Firmicutes bacterium HGW-Firmicutes-1]
MVTSEGGKMDIEIIISAQKDQTIKNQVIEAHIPLVIHTLSNILGRYICTENSNEYSTGLIALDEAINKYNPDKGSFSNFATLVIRNRVIDEMRKENQLNVVSIDDYQDIIEVRSSDLELKEEIEEMSIELEKFSICFEDLVEASPNHYDTRARCFRISEQSSEDEPIVKLMYKQYNLPVKEMIIKFLETKRFLYRNKSYITCLIIIFYKNFEAIKYWVQGTLRDDQHENI